MTTKIREALADYYRPQTTNERIQWRTRIAKLLNVAEAAKQCVDDFGINLLSETGDKLISALAALEADDDK